MAEYDEETLQDAFDDGGEPGPEEVDLSARSSLLHWVVAATAKVVGFAGAGNHASKTSTIRGREKENGGAYSMSTTCNPSSDLLGGYHSTWCYSLQVQLGPPAICSQAKAEKEFQGGGDAEQPVDAEEAERASKEADSRSVYVGQVDYDCTPEELQRHFQVNTTD